MTEPATMLPEEQDQERPWCNGATADGEPCRVPEAMLHQDADGVWWCFTHDPQTKASHYAATQRGGAVSKRRLSRNLTPGELGELKTLEDVQRQTAILNEAGATGRLSPPQVTAQLRVLALFLKAEDLRVRRDDVAALRREVEILKRGGRLR